jgi:hypothetical protein
MLRNHVTAFLASMLIIAKSLSLGGYKNSFCAIPRFPPTVLITFSRLALILHLTIVAPAAQITFNSSPPILTAVTNSDS